MIKESSSKSESSSHVSSTSFFPSPSVELMTECSPHSLLGSTEIPALKIQEALHEFT